MSRRLGALPKEQGRFRSVDKDFRDIMTEIAANPRLIVLAQRKDLSNLLKSMLDQLGRCQKALNELLEVRQFTLSDIETGSRLVGETFDLSPFLLHRRRRSAGDSRSSNEPRRYSISLEEALCRHSFGSFRRKQPTHSRYALVGR